MTTLLDPIDRRAATVAQAIPPATADATEPARRLRATTAAVRLAFTWPGTQKALTPAQRARAAAAFDAEGPSLAAGKKLLDVKHPAFRAVTAIRGQIQAYWKGVSLPYPEPGLRLIRQDAVEAFARQMADCRVELDDAVRNLDRHYGELRRAAAERLGSLYDPADYPETLVGLFAVASDFPSVEPPEYLMQLSPALYERERARMVARFEEAVRLSEQAFLEEFARLVGHLAGRLGGVGADGQPRATAGGPSARRGAVGDQPGPGPRPGAAGRRAAGRRADRAGRRVTGDRSAAMTRGRSGPRPPTRHPDREALARERAEQAERRRRQRLPAPGGPRRRHGRELDHVPARPRGPDRRRHRRRHPDSTQGSMIDRQAPRSRLRPWPGGRRLSLALRRHPSEDNH
ncbi:MAG TPA: hypothetical protein VG406_20225 [Isosphaeraceae bacterium]|jgi:hypothetical protein|nr:hypothetical protein [Isosphaeraceae bacterium]